MSAQPKALFLADVIESDLKSAAHHDEAAAELRRLHAKNERIYAQHASVVSDYEKAVVTLKAQRDALLEALRLAATNLRAAGVDELDGSLIQADLAIAKAEEGK